MFKPANPDALAPNALVSDARVSDRGNQPLSQSLASFRQAFTAGFARHLPIYLVVGLIFAVALIVQARIGVSIYYGYAAKVCWTLVVYPAQIFALLFAKRYLENVFIAKSRTPASMAFNSLIAPLVGKTSSVSQANVVNFVHFLLAFLLFSVSFGALKTSIALLNAFAWDEVLHTADRALHFGYLPHEWLSFIVDHPFAVFVVNFFYNIWYFVILGALFFAGYSRNDPYRLRFIVALFALWLIGGFFIATAFSSAGPCFFERAGFGTDYAPLMAKLNAANAIWPIWALPTQDMLWSGFKGELSVSPGISAFPSMHVASAVLVALWAFKRNRLWGWLATGYAAAIMIGSVALAWHYAVDGYASAVLTVLIWKAVGWIIPLDHGDAMAPALSAEPEVV